MSLVNSDICVEPIALALGLELSWCCVRVCVGEVLMGICQVLTLVVKGDVEHVFYRELQRVLRF